MPSPRADVTQSRRRPDRKTWLLSGFPVLVVNMRADLLAVLVRITGFVARPMLMASQLAS
jgi:hypothetical protein